MPKLSVAVLLAALVSLTAGAAAANAPVLRGSAAVMDGDTMEVGGVTVRLLHIDAPETGQPFGREATAILAALTAGQRVTCRGGGSDSYGRRLATCTAGGRDLSAEMVERLTWFYEDTGNAEELARWREVLSDLDPG
mgnify:CR=1 FL=1